MSQVRTQQSQHCFVFENALEVLASNSPSSTCFCRYDNCCFIVMIIACRFAMIIVFLLWLGFVYSRKMLVVSRVNNNSKRRVRVLCQARALLALLHQYKHQYTFHGDGGSSFRSLIARREKETGSMREKARCCSDSSPSLRPFGSTRLACMRNTHLPRIGNVSPERCSKRLPFPSMQCCSTALTRNIIAISSGTACPACDSCRRNLGAYFTCVSLGGHATALAGDRTGAGRMGGNRTRYPHGHAAVAQQQRGYMTGWRSWRVGGLVRRGSGPSRLSVAFRRRRRS